MQRAGLVGQKFGRYTVISYAETKGGRAYWNVKCDCGEFRKASTSNLKGGLVLSCGCLMRENAASANTTHGATCSRQSPREYRAWKDMKSRCYNPNRDRAGSYYLRGIKVCDRWEHSFENFLADMGKCPEGMSLDRINNDENYSPENCRWANKYQQAGNRRSSWYEELNGERKTLMEWVNDPRCELTYWGLRTRLDRGWTFEKALTTKKLKSRHEPHTRS